MLYKATKPGFVCLSYLSMLYIVLLFIRAPFYVLFVFVAVCSVFWLFWLSCYYLPSDWLERPLWGSLIMAKRIVSVKPWPKSTYDFLGLLYYFIVLFCVCVVSWPYVIYFPTSMARYSLFVLKVLLNTKQTNSRCTRTMVWRCWQIDMASFLTLTDVDLKELGITTFGARRKLLVAIAGLSCRS